MSVDEAIDALIDAVTADVDANLWKCAKVAEAIEKEWPEAAEPARVRRGR